jgi:hypothetical protein
MVRPEEVGYLTVTWCRQEEVGYLTVTWCRQEEVGHLTVTWCRHKEVGFLTVTWWKIPQKEGTGNHKKIRYTASQQIDVVFLLDVYQCKA